MGRLRYDPLVYFSALLKVIKMKKMTSVQQYAHCVIVNFFRIQSVSMLLLAALCIEFLYTATICVSLAYMQMHNRVTI